MVDQNEVRMKRIATAAIGDGEYVILGVDANGVVYFHDGDFESGRWVPIRMRTDKGDE